MLGLVTIGKLLVGESVKTVIEGSAKKHRISKGLINSKTSQGAFAMIIPTVLPALLGLIGIDPGAIDIPSASAEIVQVAGLVWALYGRFSVKVPLIKAD